jgi:hypothetical protein
METNNRFFDDKKNVVFTVLFTDKKGYSIAIRQLMY